MYLLFLLPSAYSEKNNSVVIPLEGGRHGEQLPNQTIPKGVSDTETDNTLLVY